VRGLCHGLGALFGWGFLLGLKSLPGFGYPDWAGGSLFGHEILFGLGEACSGRGFCLDWDSDWIGASCSSWGFCFDWVFQLVNEFYLICRFYSAKDPPQLGDVI